MKHRADTCNMLMFGSFKFISSSVATCFKIIIYSGLANTTCSVTVDSKQFVLAQVVGCDGVN